MPQVFKYLTKYYCRKCTKWVEQCEAVFKIRIIHYLLYRVPYCPDCKFRLRTKRRYKNMSRNSKPTPNMFINTILQ